MNRVTQNYGTDTETVLVTAKSLGDSIVARQPPAKVHGMRPVSMNDVTSSQSTTIMMMMSEWYHVRVKQSVLLD